MTVSSAAEASDGAALGTQQAPSDVVFHGTEVLGTVEVGSPSAEVGPMSAGMTATGLLAISNEEFVDSTLIATVKVIATGLSGTHGIGHSNALLQTFLNHATGDVSGTKDGKFSDKVGVSAQHVASAQGKVSDQLEITGARATGLAHPTALLATADTLQESSVFDRSSRLTASKTQVWFKRESSKGLGLGVGAVVGIMIGVLVVVAAVIFALVLFARRKASDAEVEAAEPDVEMEREACQAAGCDLDELDELSSETGPGTPSTA
jgi:hypothetical protein